MGRKQKKGQEGDAVKYIARAQAVRKLQISLSQFRRLCILKGVYPVEPKNKKKVGKGSTAPRTYYYRKDIQYLLHEPVLAVLREEKSHDKKLTKALSKRQYSLAKTLHEARPFYTLDHIIKERYPSFTDALRDLDDALSMIFLFATLPVDDKIKLEHVRECQRLSTEFMQVVMATRCLKKVFLSIKGIYYQIEVRGQLITWVTPYAFSQHVPSDVDFRVMGTFLELYETLVGFINFKLYSDLGLVYPPKFDSKMDAGGAGLDSIVLESKDSNQVVETIAKAQGALKKKHVSKAKLESVQQTIMTLKNESDDEPENEESEESENEMQEDDQVPQPVEEPTTAEEMLPTLINEADSEDAQAAKLLEGCIFWVSREVSRSSLEFVIRSFGGQVGWDESAGSGSLFKEDDSRITHHILDRPLPEDTEARAALIKYQSREYLQPQWVYDCVNAKKLVKTAGYHPGETLPPHLSPFVVVKEGDYNPEEPEEIDEIERAADIEEDAEFEDDEPVQKKTKVDPEVEAKNLATMMMSKRDKKLYDKIQFGKNRKEEAANKLRAKKAALSKEE